MEDFKNYRFKETIKISDLIKIVYGNIVIGNRGKNRDTKQSRSMEWIETKIFRSL